MSGGQAKTMSVRQVQLDRLADFAHGRSKAEAAGQASIRMQILKVRHRL